MPSPFPGMDPYLEDPARWPDFHSRFVPALAEAISDRVAPAYIVRLDERIYVTDEAAENERLIRPDAAVVASAAGLPHYALVYRAARRPLCEVYPFNLRDPLPEVPVPLRHPGEVRITLQPVFDTCYARARYDLDIDYSHPGVPPLSEDDAAWAASLTPSG